MQLLDPIKVFLLWNNRIELAVVFPDEFLRGPRQFEDFSLIQTISKHRKSVNDAVGQGDYVLNVLHLVKHLVEVFFFVFSLSVGFAGV